MFASLGTVLLYVGSFLEIIDMSVAGLASLIILFCLIELGYAAAFSVYSVISVISLLILPNKWVAFYFVFFFGPMPITKKIFEKTGREISWILKFAVFNAELVAFYFIVSALGFFDENEISKLFAIAALILLNVVFLLSDILYGKLYRIYMVKYRHRIKRFLK